MGPTLDETPYFETCLEFRLSRIEISFAVQESCDNFNEPEISLKSSLRTVLAESHVSDVAIAALLLHSLNSAFLALWLPISRAATFICTAIAILDVPYYSRTLNAVDRMQLTELWGNFISALSAVASAWVLSRWIHGVGPIRSLTLSCKRLTRSNHV